MTVALSVAYSSNDNYNDNEVEEKRERALKILMNSIFTLD
jgi:hypothetical protein